MLTEMLASALVMYSKIAEGGREGYLEIKRSNTRRCLKQGPKVACTL